MAAGERYWVVENLVGGRGSVPLYQVVTSPSRPKGDTYQVVAGPFGTKADAEKALQNLSNPIKLPDVDIPNPLSGLSPLGRVAHWVGDFVLHLVDWHMWVSIGWLILGAILLFLGVSLFLKLPQKAAKLAPLAAL